jgi:competence protein ComEC
VNFAVLHPDSDAEARKTNALSCVLLVEAGGKKVLITSDIEAAQESALVGRRLANLAADVLLVPHHGSRTSSTPEFIAAVGAPDVIFPVGYRNRFGHPKDEVVERYRATGARLHRTDSDGAIRIALSPQGVALSHERDRQRRYWQGQ